MSTRVSIVIPAYNEEANIARAIQAALGQDHPDYEVIVVDNASTDRTGEIARSFPVTVVHESKKGLLHAREAGRTAATGSLIANMDADCLPDADWLSRAAARFDADARVIAVTGPYDYHDGHPMFRTASLATQKLVYKPMSLILQAPYIRTGALLIGGNNIIRAHVLEKAGGYNTALAFYGEDTDTAKRIFPYGNVLFVRDLAMKTSARRFKAEGTLQLMAKYWYYFFKHVFFTDKKAA